MSKEAVFVVTLSPAPSSTVTLNYTTRNGTATSADGDFTPRTGTLTFLPGQTSKEVTVPVVLASPGELEERFFLDLSWPTGSANTLARGTGICIIPGGTTVDSYLSRFQWTYDVMKADETGYFGPPTGPNAKTIPYHSIEKLIVEAPDWGHQTVSETASFWSKLEAWNIAMGGTTAGYVNSWNSIETNFIPSTVNQPIGTYDPLSPATYQPEGDTPQAYPTLPDITVVAGADPLYAPLLANYGNKNMYLMHWLFDVDGDFGFKNGDGTTKMVAINNYQRGMQESTWEAVTHCAWEDWANGNSNPYGFLPLYSQATPVYPEAPFAYAKQWRYTCAPDAEARVISSAYLAKEFAAERSLPALTAQDTKAKKMGDYLRYALYDKYFRAIPGHDGSGCHFLVSWYVAWGGEIPAPGVPGSWGFRIGSSESHQGYNGIDIAYMMSTAGGAYTPTTPGAAAQWAISLDRQLEMMRWLQSSEGPIAGGVSNSWRGRYEIPNDGRQFAKFYGLYYTYAPVWHDPPSNNWFGFQAWGLERLASTSVLVAGKSGTFNTSLYTRLNVILDKFVAWLLANATTTGGTFTLPIVLSWVSNVPVPGQTTTTPNLAGVYEYIPQLNWDGTGNYATFWSANAVPNPSIHCTVTESGRDLGSAAAAAQLLIQYAAAKIKAGGTLSNFIPGTARTLQECVTLAKTILDVIWNTYKDTRGFARSETRLDYNRFDDPIYIPPSYTGSMPNGDVINSASTFVSIRSFMKTDPAWPQVQNYLDGGAAPSLTYHRFWHTAEIACAFAMMHRYFPTVSAS